MRRAQRVSKVAVLAVGVALALSACIQIDPITGAGAPTYDAPGPGGYAVMNNPNVDLFTCYGNTLFDLSLEGTGQCKARYEGTGIIARIPQACIDTAHSYYTAFQTPTTPLGPVEVLVLEEGTGQVLASVADAGVLPWSRYTPGFPAKQSGIVAHGVIFTTSGLGRLTRGTTAIDTPRLAVQDTYRVQITCATNWDPTTGVVTRQTDDGTYSPT